MIPFSLKELAQELDGQLIGADIQIEQVCSDSRQLQPGDFFIALKGPNFDGHKFVQQAAEQGCLAALVEQQQNVDIPQLVVADCYKAMGKMAALVKARVNPKTVAITGSSGKTTVKEMLAAILSRKGKVLATKGNFNNEIGVPLTLLRLTHEHQYAVIELGANHLGEIAYTTSLTKPDVAMINNIAAAHLEGFGSLTGVAKAKGEIFSGLPENGVAIYNQQALHSNEWQWRLEKLQVKQFSSTEKADCYSTNARANLVGCYQFTLHTEQGEIEIELPIPGQHNVSNAIAAAAAALEFDTSLEDIKLGLEQMTPVQGRLNLHTLSPKLTVIDDTYNANVESVKAAVSLLSNFDGTRMLILGDMAELGEDARQYHQEIGEYAQEQGIEHLLTLGVLSQSTSAVYEQRSAHFSSRETLIKHLSDLLANSDEHFTILVKGSRSARMELVVKDIAQQYPSNKGQENSSC
ncbi:UDP-N-acetylmuramoyl-tripeptide--D-alanyl-D-alanine ligase [Thalassotalea aquiviva]|uniref:UDP-N-acetylmuramoyl-tripeptide--D-alanyl-D- alanine ligase n=1 Tax=Thalassotalea aquiviva TaxID=3242415 RepID=UPI00352A836D